MAGEVTVLQLQNAALDAQTLAQIAMVGYAADTTTNRDGDTLNTVQGQLKLLGYIPPIAYAGAISFGALEGTKTVERLGIVYAPVVSSLPFTTSGTWVGDDDAKFVVVQVGSVSAADISASVTGLSATDVNAALQELENENDSEQTNIANLQMLTGLSSGSVDYGTGFTGQTIPSSSNAKQAFQALETSLEANIYYKSSTVAGTANAITCNSSPVSIASYVDGYTIVLTPASTTTSAVVTIAINGLAAVNIKRTSAASSNLIIGDIRAGYPAILCYRSSISAFELLNPCISLNLLEQPAAQAYVKSTTLTFVTTLAAAYYALENYTLVCSSADAGYSVGDFIVIPSSGAGTSANTGWASMGTGIAANIYFIIGSAGIEIPHKTTRAMTIIADSKWNVYPVFRYGTRTS